MKVKQDATVNSKNSNEESDFVSIHFDDSIEGNHYFQYYYSWDETCDYPIRVYFKINLKEHPRADFSIEYTSDAVLEEISKVELLIYKEVSTKVNGKWVSSSFIETLNTQL